MNAPVSFIVASDFNCERCVAFEATLQRIYDKYKDQVKFGFVSFGDFPTLPALACEAAARQDKFWDFHDDILHIKVLQIPLSYLISLRLKLRYYSIQERFALFREL